MVAGAFIDLADFQVCIYDICKDLNARCGTELNQNSSKIGWK